MVEIMCSFYSPIFCSFVNVLKTPYIKRGGSSYLISPKELPKVICLAEYRHDRCLFLQSRHESLLSPPKEGQNHVTERLQAMGQTKCKRWRVRDGTLERRLEALRPDEESLGSYNPVQVYILIARSPEKHTQLFQDKDFKSPKPVGISKYAASLPYPAPPNQTCLNLSSAWGLTNKIGQTMENMSCIQQPKQQIRKYKSRETEVMLGAE